MGRSPNPKIYINGKSRAGSSRLRSATDSSIEIDKNESIGNTKDAVDNLASRRRLSFKRVDSASSYWSMDDSNADTESYIEGQNIDIRLLPNNEFVCASNPRNGYTALHRSVEGSDNSVGIVKALVNANIDCLNMHGNSGITALHLSCQLGRKMITKSLLVSLFYVNSI